MPDDTTIALCGALTDLSAAVWDTYARPASAATDEDEQDRREFERGCLDKVVPALRAPRSLDALEPRPTRFSMVEESAHRLGRLLRQADDPRLTEAVAAEVSMELDAVTRAEQGDLSGRAVQATALDRLDASPVQIAAADELLRADPLGTRLWQAPVDPTAGCVAAAHWLAAAAAVAAEAAGDTPAGMFADAKDIHDVTVTVPALVVERVLTEAVAPRRVVIDLLRAGTALDPRRPARHLLDQLIDGISTCHAVYSEFALNDDGSFSDTYDDEDERLRRAQLDDEFTEAVREAAAHTRARLS